MPVTDRSVPRYPFPAVLRSSADWWREAPSIALPSAGAKSRLSLGWDEEALHLHVQGAPKSGRLLLAGLAALERDGACAAVRDKDGNEVPDAAFLFDDGAATWDVSIPWSALGGPVSARRHIPVYLAWRAGRGRERTLPANPTLVNPLTWGVFFLNDTVPLAECAPVLTRPFRFRFDPDPRGGRPALHIRPEPVAGLCLPAEVAFTRIGAEEEETLGKCETEGGTARLILPKVPEEDLVQVSLLPLRYAIDGALSEYATFAPGRKIADFHGTTGWEPPADWDAFWARARADLEEVPMNPRVTEVPERATKTGRMYRVDLDSLGGVAFSGWYYVPRDVDFHTGKAERRYPAIQVMPGYGAEEPPIDRTAEGYITFAVSPRGHGPSNDFWPLPEEHLTHGVEEPERYYYRGAFMDCVRAIEFLRGRPEVDAGRIGVEGGSQGGAFALATAALAPGIAACAANVPFLSDFPSAVRLCTRGGYAALKPRFEAKTLEGAAVRRTLSYIDVRFMARRITCPTLVAVCLMDRTCPPATGISDYHNLPASTPKELLMIPGRDHEVTPPWRRAADALYARTLKGSSE